MAQFWSRYPVIVPETASPGMYFARFGFFDPKTGNRLPVMSPDGRSIGDEVTLGPLYVGEDEAYPMHLHRLT